MSDDLKPLPCPFCGEQEGVYSEAGTEATGPHAAIVRCSGCNAVHCHNTEAEAIAAWNRRAAPDLLATLEALRPQLLACHGASGGLTEAARNGAMAMVMAAIAKTKVPAS